MTEETDKQFVERMAQYLADEDEDGQSWHRLLALALRGAETQWRPISEYDNNDYVGGVIVRMHNGHARWLDRIALCDRRDFTHFIPLTALGEPK